MVGVGAGAVGGKMLDPIDFCTKMKEFAAACFVFFAAFKERDDGGTFVRRGCPTRRVS